MITKLPIDELGINTEENAAINALSGGVSQEDVNKLTDGKVQLVSSLDSQFQDSNSKQNEDSQFKTTSYQPIPKSKAARKAMYAAVASKNYAAYERMYDQMASTGNTSNLDVIKQAVDNEAKSKLLLQADKLASEGDVDGLASFYKAVPGLIKKGLLPTVSAVQNQAEDVIQRSKGTVDREELDGSYLNSMHSWIDTRDKIVNLIELAKANVDPSLGNYVTDTADTLLGEQPFALSKVGRDILGERYWTLGGSMFRDLAREISTQTTEESQIAKAKEIIESISKHAGNLKNNNFVKHYALDTLEIMLKSPGDDDKFTRWTTDVFGVVDLVSVIPTGIAVKWLRGLNKLRQGRSALRAADTLRRELQEIDPELDALLTSRSIQDTSVAESLGTTSEDALLKVMPREHFDTETMLQGAPNSVINHFTNETTRAEDIIKFTDNTFQFAEPEYAAKQARITRALYNDDLQAISRPTETEVSRSLDRNEMNVRAVYNLNDARPIIRLEKANEVKRVLEEAVKGEGLKTTPEIFVRNKVTGMLEKFDPENHLMTRRKITPMTVSDRQGNLFPNPLKRPYGKEYKTLRPEYSGYSVILNTKAPLRNSDILPGAILGEGSTRGVGLYGRWYINPQNWLNRRILSMFRVATDKKDLIKHDLFKLASPLTKLKYYSKKRVANLLEVGDKDEHVFTYNELASGGYSNKEIEAYYSTRILEDAIYRIKNYNLRQKLVDDGYRAITIPRGGNLPTFENAIKEIETIPSNVKEIFDPEANTFYRVDENTIESLRERGLKVGRLLSKVERENNINHYIAYRESFTNDLPNNVFPYREGHITRINSDPYFIDRFETKIIDGVSTPNYKRTIGVEPNHYKALRTVERLNSESGGNNHRLRIDRNFTLEKSALEYDLDALKNPGDNFWFSKRGPQLRRFSDGSLSEVEDPIVSLDRATSSVANVITHGKLLDSELVRHRQTYGNLLGNGDRKLWYFDTNSKEWRFDKAAAQGFNDRAVRAALHDYEYLEDMKYTPTTVDVKWKQLMAEIDSVFGRHSNLVSTVSKKLFLNTFGSTTPDRFARGFAFASTIPLRPLRQLLLQSSTGLYLTGIDPVATIKSIRDANLLMLSLASRDNPRSWNLIKKWSRLYGYSDDEWEKTFDAFKKSGKAYTIDSHLAVNEISFEWSRSIPDTAIGEYGRKLGNLIKSPITVGKAIGFDTGELHNQALTWLFSKRQWEKRHPNLRWNAHQTYLDEINAEARNVSVDMTKTDALRYQKGIFGAMTQFLAIHNKMLLKLFPASLGGDPTLSGRNAIQTALIKGRLMGGLLAIYGTAGLGMPGLYDNWKKENNIDVPEPVDQILFGGMLQYAFDSSFDLAFNLPVGTTRTDVSSQFSPTGGIFTAPIDFGVSLLNGDFIQALSGPSGQQFPNVYRAAKFASQAFGFDDLNTLQKVGLAAEVAAEEFSGFSDYFKFNMAMAYKDKLDKLYTVGKNGRPTAEANATSEIWSKLLFATGTRSEFELYNKWYSASQEYTSFGKENEGQIDSDAKNLSKWMYREWAKSDGDWDKMAQRTQALTFSLHRANRTYGLKVYEKAKAYFQLDPKFGKFVEDYARNYMLADPQRGKESLINFVNNSDYIPNENKKHIIDSINQWERSNEIDSVLLDRVLDE